MALPAVPTGAIIQATFRGTDGHAQDLENVQWFQYVAGFAPTPAGIPLDVMAAAASGEWAARWRPFQCVTFSYQQCTLRVAAGFLSVPPNKYNVVVQSQWTDNNPQGAGAVAGDSLPSFNAFGIRKLSAAPGRGRQGQIRIPGVPESSTINDAVDGGVLGALAAALVPSFLNLNISVAHAFSDTLFPIIIDGKLVTTAPLNPPSFYATFIEGFTPASNVSSQITRKLLRHRRHH